MCVCVCVCVGALSTGVKVTFNISWNICLCKTSFMLRILYYRLVQCNFQESQ